MPVPFRQRMMEKGGGHEPDFHWRGGDVSRIEALADAVFAFALTLLVVSLEVPKTYDELIYSMRGFFSFAACFALLSLIWYSHYVFFRRYGLEDTQTIFLNTILLFVVLFYIYPLKFLATLIIDNFAELFGAPSENVGGIIDTGDIGSLMMIYSSGFVAVFGIIALMFRHALQKREELELDPVEVLQTRAMVSHSMIYVWFGIASIALAWLGRFVTVLVPLSGILYAFIGIAFAVHGRRLRSGIAALKAAE